MVKMILKQRGVGDGRRSWVGDRCGGDGRRRWVGDLCGGDGLSV